MLIDFDLMYLIDEKLFNTKSSSNTKKHLNGLVF